MSEIFRPAARQQAKPCAAAKQAPGVAAKLRLSGARAGGCLRLPPAHTEQHSARRRVCRQGPRQSLGPNSARQRPCAHLGVALCRSKACPAQGTRVMTAKMVAVGYAASLPITEERSLFEFETTVPQPGERDLLVRVQAVSVNPGRRQVAHAQAGNTDRASHSWMGRGRHRRGGWPRLQPVQARRPRLLRRQHQPSRNQRALPPGRRTHRRAQAEIAQLRRGGSAALDHHHRLGAAVRSDRGEARRGGGSPLAPDRRRRWRGRLDRHPARTQAHRPLHHSHRLAPANASLGAQPRRTACDRPQQALCSTTEGGRLPYG